MKRSDDERSHREAPAPWEVRLWRFGIALTLALVAEVLLLHILAPDWGRAAAGAIVAEVFSGREGGIPVAIAAELPPLLVWQLSVTQDVAAFLLTFPFFLVVIHRYHDHPGFLMRQVRRIEAKAARHETYVRRWGPLGVFLFMLAPFLVNGPLVGGVAGRIAGIPTRRLLLPVVAASVAAAAAWVFVYDQTIGRLRDVDPRLGWLVAGTIAGALLLTGGSAWIIDERRQRSERGAAPALGDADESE